MGPVGDFLDSGCVNLGQNSPPKVLQQLRGPFSLMVSRNPQSELPSARLMLDGIQDNGVELFDIHPRIYLRI